MNADIATKPHRRPMVPPITLIVKLLQQQTPVVIWLFEQVGSRIEGTIRGLDEFVNLVLDNAVEVKQATGARRELGRILLKGDNVSLIQAKS